MQSVAFPPQQGFRFLTHLCSSFLKLLQLSLIDAAALVDEVAGGGRLAAVDVSDDHHVDVSLLFHHGSIRGFRQTK